jgi:hypothetical protein
VAPIAGQVAATHPQLVRAVLALALAEDPADRFQTAGAFADALEAAVRGEEPVPLGGEAAVDADQHASVAVQYERGLEEATVDSSGPVGRIDRGEPAATDDGAAALGEARPEAPLDSATMRRGGRSEPPLADLEGFHRVSPEPTPDRVLSFDQQAEPAAPDRDEEASRADEEERRKVSSSAESAGKKAIESDSPTGGRGRGTLLPGATVFVLGLLVGFLAGYGLGLREGRPVAGVTSVAAPAEVPDVPTADEGETSVSESTGESPAADPPGPAPAAESPVPAEPAGARLLVRSTPAGARVRVNGADRGTTPLTLRGLAFGSYGIELRHDGYRNASRQIVLTEQLPFRELTFQLERAANPGTAADRPAPGVAAASTESRGTLVADSRPRGARVLLDGRPVGTTPLRLTTAAVGRHEVRFELAGYRTWRTEVSIVADSETRVSGSLEREQP